MRAAHDKCASVQAKIASFSAPSQPGGDPSVFSLVPFRATLDCYVIFTELVAQFDGPGDVIWAASTKPSVNYLATAYRVDEFGSVIVHSNYVIMLHYSSPQINHGANGVILGNRKGYRPRWSGNKSPKADKKDRSLLYERSANAVSPPPEAARSFLASHVSGTTGRRSASRRYNDLRFTRTFSCLVKNSLTGT